MVRFTKSKKSGVCHSPEKGADNGSIRMLVITEKQYESIEILLGKHVEADERFQCEQLTIF